MLTYPAAMTRRSTHKQELTNGLKTDRGLLSLAVALVHNCCSSSPSQPQPQPRERGDDCGGRKCGSQRENEARGGEGKQEGEEEKRLEDKGRERLGRLVADRAFCCLLMKVWRISFISRGCRRLRLPKLRALRASHEGIRVMYVHFKMIEGVTCFLFRGLSRGEFCVVGVHTPGVLFVRGGFRWPHGLVLLVISCSRLTNSSMD